MLTTHTYTNTHHTHTHTGEIQCRGASNDLSIICAAQTLQRCHCGGDSGAKCLASSACCESLPCSAQQHNSTPNSVETTSVHAHIPVAPMRRRCWSKELAHCVRPTAFRNSSRQCRGRAKPCARLPCPRSVQQSARCSDGYTNSSTPFCEHETFRPGQSQRRSLADFVQDQVRSEEVCHGKLTLTLDLTIQLPNRFETPNPYHYPNSYIHPHPHPNHALAK